MTRSVEPAIAKGTMASTRQPTFAIDDELTARPFRFGDIVRLIEAYADADIQHWHARRIETVLAARQLIGHGHAMWLQERSASFAIADPDDRLVARVALHTDLPAGTAEIAYWVLPDSRRQGVAVRAAQAVTRWGHEHLGLSRILLEHSVLNTASCAVASSLGYGLEATLRSVQLLDDGRHDVHIHTHLAAD